MLLSLKRETLEEIRSHFFSVDIAVLGRDT